VEQSRWVQGDTVHGTRGWSELNCTGKGGVSIVLFRVAIIDRRVGNHRTGTGKGRYHKAHKNSRKKTESLKISR
jgi:hypothetical protein